MKRYLLLIYCFSALISVVAQPKREVRAVWFDTPHVLGLYNGHDETGQKKLISELLDRLYLANINTVLMQVQADGAVAWQSDIQPAMRGITGDGDKPLPWDICSYVIEECHRRGMECHARVTAYDSGTGLDLSSYGDNAIKHPAETVRELCRLYKGRYYLDPGLPETSEYLSGLYRELLSGYDFDGINIDYARYPDNGFDDSDTYRHHSSGNISLADWRRENINSFIADIHDMAKEINPLLKVSATTAGTYKNIHEDTGPTAYDSCFQDAREWIQSGNLDMVIPQMFMDESYGFSDNIETWIDNTGEGMTVIGIAPSSDNGISPSEAMAGQIEKIRDHSEIAGISIYPSHGMAGADDATDQILKSLGTYQFRYPAHLPVSAQAGIDAPPSPENVTADYYNGTYTITWDEPAATDYPIKYYTVYLRNGDEDYTADVRNEIAHIVTGTTFEYPSPDSGLQFAVTAFDMCYAESAPSLSATAGNPETDRSIDFRYAYGTITIYSGIPLKYVDIYTSTGNHIKHIETSGCDLTVSCDGLEGGMYIVTVVQNDGSRNVYKFVR